VVQVYLVAPSPHMVENQHGIPHSTSFGGTF